MEIPVGYQPHGRTRQHCHTRSAADTAPTVADSSRTRWPRCAARHTHRRLIPALRLRATPLLPSFESATANTAAGARTLPIGTEIHAALDDSINSRTDTAGRAVTALVMENVTGSDGKTLIAAGAPVRFTVTRLSAAKSKSAEGRLALRVDGVGVGGQIQRVRPTCGRFPTSFGARCRNRRSGQGWRRRGGRRRARQGDRKEHEGCSDRRRHRCRRRRSSGLADRVPGRGGQGHGHRSRLCSRSRWWHPRREGRKRKDGKAITCEPFGYAGGLSRLSRPFPSFPSFPSFRIRCFSCRTRTAPGSG